MIKWILFFIVALAAAGLAVRVQAASVNDVLLTVYSSPAPSSLPKPDTASTFSITKNNFALHPSFSIDWLRFERFWTTDTIHKINLTQAITNTLLLRMQENITNSLLVSQLLTDYTRESQNLTILVDRVTAQKRDLTSPFDSILADQATQLAMIDKLSPYSPDATKDGFAAARNALIRRNVAFLTNPRLSDSERERKAVYFVNQYAERDERKTVQIPHKLDLENDITAATKNKTIISSLQDLEENLTHIKHIASDDPKQKSKLVFSLNTSANASSSSSSNFTAANNTVKIAIVVSGKNLQESSHYGVNKGTEVQITFQNKDPEARKLVFSNGITSDESSNGSTVTVPTFTITKTITYSVPGENMKGTIDVF